MLGLTVSLLIVAKLLLVNKVDDVTHNQKVVCHVIGNGKAKFVFQSHDKVGDIQAVCAKVFDQIRFHGNLGFFNSKLLRDKFLNFFKSHCSFLQSFIVTDYRTLLSNSTPFSGNLQAF